VGDKRFFSFLSLFLFSLFSFLSLHFEFLTIFSLFFLSLSPSTLFSLLSLFFFLKMEGGGNLGWIEMGWSEVGLCWWWFKRAGPPPPADDTAAARLTEAEEEDRLRWFGGDNHVGVVDWCCDFGYDEGSRRFWKVWHRLWIVTGCE